MAQRFITLILLLCSILLAPHSAQASLFGDNAAFGQKSAQSRFIPVDQAFAFDFRQQGDQLTLSWQVHPDYYLYRQQIKIVPQDATLGVFTLPEGIAHHDEFYGEVAIFKQQLILTIPITQAGEHASVSVTYQGCAEAGFCYPPETRVVPLSAITAGSSAVTAPPITAPATPAPAELPFSPLWALLIGIGIAFTPCVLPMYPLISAIILGREKPHSQRRILLLAVVYVQGMALTYTLLGLVVAAAGLQFQAALQHPYVLIGLSALFVLLALSMFGLYSLQLPSSLQTRLVQWSSSQRGGSLAGVFAMGALAGLICSPCTTAPLSAILLYIAQSGNMLAGGGTLYLYALGMGIPLVIVTLFGNKLLPRSGPWMQYVKEAFGFVILALPVFLLERVLGDVWGLRLWSLLAIAFFGWAFVLSLKAHSGWARAFQLLLLAALLVAARPLQDWAFGNHIQQSEIKHLGFKSVADLPQLQAALAQAKGQPVMLDLYADWCVACKEFEKYTFSDDKVQRQLADTVLLQADVTANSTEQAAMLKKLNVLGLPTILFFDAQGNEITAARVTGFMDAAQFLQHLQNQQR
ncbi:cytochrome C biogenesis transmembrane region family protein [Yersinia rochesterensis]|uniref:Thiol:disulfide interchange protein DsbD n=1 Tax=Yersinia rochesterensis TaxID=1604335 RepID=A0A386HAW4_9GAMM|nr:MULTISPECIES: protein-disulfide reductase DsbD [Yersinia]AJI88950.1 disulfide interchange protein DsbD [Yersinia frederiksenii Y225]CNH10937.1 thiol:disulfide interchange protein [Yersinia kristensenii]AIN18488.1 disulfide interchange protein DsbD [Yersinia rochesterensis]AJJ37333.1 cytochrome C biogenesis transmembrane region family protein [Yersinia rochesterensis]AYD42654.1 protein-disulfide reductase DsbD [Yersinia rochesterensis]